MKKTTKGLLSALLLTAMCGAVGCKPVETSTGTPSTGTTISSTSSSEAVVEAQNLLSSIVDTGDGCYTVTEADGKTTVAFNKPAGKEWASAKVDLSGIANKEKMNTLRFKVSGVGQLILKFEGTAGTAEVKLFVYDTESNYEWGFVDEDFAKIGAAHSLIIFAAAGGAGEGSVSFSELTLTPALAGDDTSYQIITTNYKNFIDGPHVYDGISKDFHFSWDWACNDGDVYTFEYGDNGITVNYTKPDNTREWAYALTPVAGDFSKMNFLNFKATGTKGKGFTAKVAQADANKSNVPGFNDGHFNFSGTEDTFSVDISGLTPEAKRLIGNVFFFAEGGKFGADVNGSFVLHDAWFSQTAPDSAKVNKYVSGDDFSVNQFWSYDSIYSVTEANGKTTVAWENATNDNRWTNINAPYKGDVSVFGELYYSITVNANTAIRVSLPGAGDLGDLVNVGNNESKTFEGYFSLSKFTKDALKNTDKVMMFPLMAINDSANVDAGEQKEYDVPTTGSIEINALKFTHARSFINETDGSVDVKAADWFGPEAATITAEENGAKIAYTKGSWDTVKFRLDASAIAEKGYTKAIVKFTGLEGTGTILKFEGENGGGVEEKYLNEEWNPTDRGFMTGEEQTAEFDITALNTGAPIRFLVFTEPTQAAPAAGQIVIHSITFVA